MKTSSNKPQGLSSYEQKLLDAWEDVHKKGQLTLWILLALYESPKHMNQIKDFIKDKTVGTQTADDQSMYRALRRYDDTELVIFNTQKSDNGPDLKVYELTETGHKVLTNFVQRNITDIFYNPTVKPLIKKLIAP